MEVFAASELKSEKIVRQPTGLYEFDWQMGMTDGVWGMPLGMITVVAAPAGMGKTRFLTKLSQTLIENSRHSVLFAQSEVTPAQFASEKLKDLSDNVLERFFISPETELMSQLDVIRHVRPRLAVIDSAQQIDEFAGGRGAKSVVRAYREVLQEVGCHAIFVSQQNADGSAKGGTEFSHEVDIVMKGRPGRAWYENKPFFADTDINGKARTHGKVLPGCFSLVIDDKHRYGRTPTESLWQHFDDGVRCTSVNRSVDNKYMENRPFDIDAELFYYNYNGLPVPPHVVGVHSEWVKAGRPRWYDDIDEEYEKWPTEQLQYMDNVQPSGEHVTSNGVRMQKRTKWYHNIFG